MREFLQSYSKFAPLILDFIQEFRLFLTPIEGNRRIWQRMEAAIAHNLNNQNVVVSIFKTTVFDMRQDAPKKNQ